MTRTLDSIRTTGVRLDPAGPPALSSLTRARLVHASDSLWRVLDAKGIVIGHLEVIPLGDDVRYRARRYHAPSRAFRDLGEFWSADDAVDSLRFAR